MCHIQYDDSLFRCKVCGTTLIRDEEWHRANLSLDERNELERVMNAERKERYDKIFEESNTLRRKLKALGEADPSLLRIIPHRYTVLDREQLELPTDMDLMRDEKLCREMTELLNLIRSFNINLRKLKAELADLAADLLGKFEKTQLNILLDNALFIEHSRERFDLERMKFFDAAQQRIELLSAFLDGGSFSCPAETLTQSVLTMRGGKIVPVERTLMRMRTFQVRGSLESRIRRQIAATTPNIGQVYLLFKEDMRRAKDLLGQVEKQLNKSIEEEEGRIRFRNGIVKYIPYMASMSKEKLVPVK